MPPIKVNFYLLEKSKPLERQLETCHLIERLSFEGKRVFVFCANKASAELLDKLLWTFKEESFIPHHLQQEEGAAKTAIEIAWQAKPQGSYEVLLNLSPDVPLFYRSFKEVIELVSPIETAKALSRLHYKTYKKDGCVLETTAMPGLLQEM